MKRFAAWVVISASLLFYVCSPESLSAQAAPVAKESRQEDVAAQLDALVDGRNYPELARRLASAHLDENARNYFAGVLANRENRLNDAVPLLERAVPELRRSSPKRAGIALRALGDSYTKLFRYADAERALRDAVTNFSNTFGKAERTGLTDDYGTAKLLTDAPPQYLELSRSFSIATYRSPLGTIDTDLTLNGVTIPWIVDTGANFSVVSKTTARKLGLKLSEKTATTQGITGAENTLRIAIIPALPVGVAIVHNVVVLVLEDENLNVPLGDKKYQIDAILGYPVLSAFGRLTFGRGVIYSDFDPLLVIHGAPMYMEQLTPLLLCHVQGRPLMFAFDTGANHSMFTAKYLDEFRQTLKKLPERPYGIGGAGGVKRMMVHYQPELRIAIGDSTAVLKDAPVLTKPLGTDLDKLNGNLGRDVVDNFESFTIDFTNMRFALHGQRVESAPTKSKAAKQGE